MNRLPKTTCAVLFAMCVPVMLVACSSSSPSTDNTPGSTTEGGSTTGDDNTPSGSLPTGTTLSCSATSNSFMSATSTISTPQSSSTPVEIVSGPSLLELDAFQVVAIPLVEASESVAVADRPAPLVADRAAVIRAKVLVPEEWASAEVELRVDITLAGETTAYRSSAVLDASSNLIDASSGLFVDVPAKLIQPGATYVASLWVSGASLPSARYPQTGETGLAPEITGDIKVHVVPYKVAGVSPETDQAMLDGYCNVIYAYYPTNRVDVSLAELRENPKPQEALEDVLDVLLVEVGAVMESDAEMAPVDTYYYALMGVEGTRENFNGSTGTSQELTSRAGFAAGVSFAGDVLNESTLVHELGHLQFLKHAPCGGPGLLDEEFPHADGMAHTEGYDVRTATFIAEDTGSDLMSYCQPRWVSAYNYTKMAKWIQSTSVDWK